MEMVEVQLLLVAWEIQEMLEHLAMQAQQEQTETLEQGQHQEVRGIRGMLVRQERPETQVPMEVHLDFLMLLLQVAQQELVVLAALLAIPAMLEALATLEIMEREETVALAATVVALAIPATQEMPVHLVVAVVAVAGLLFICLVQIPRIALIH